MERSEREARYTEAIHEVIDPYLPVDSLVRAVMAVADKELAESRSKVKFEAEAADYLAGRADAAEAETRALRDRLTALADGYEQKAGLGSEAWRVFGPQTVSVPFMVSTLRALAASPAVDATPESDVLDPAETVVFDALRALACPTGAVDPIDPEDCASVAAEMVRALRVVGYLPSAVDATPEPTPAAELHGMIEPDASDLRERLTALADDMDERGKPGPNDSALDAQSRRQIREDVKRLRAALAASPAVDATPDDDGYDDGLCECGRYGSHLIGCPAVDATPEPTPADQGSHSRLAAWGGAYRDDTHLPTPAAEPQAEGGAPGTGEAAVLAAALIETGHTEREAIERAIHLLRPAPVADPSGGDHG